MKRLDLMRLARRRFRSRDGAWRQVRAVFLVLLLLGGAVPMALLQAVVAAPEIPPISISYNYGVFAKLAETQERRAEKTDPAKVEVLTDPIMQSLIPQPAAREPLSAVYAVQNTTQGIPAASPIFDKIAQTPLRGLSSVLDFLLVTGPLSYAVFTNCSGIEKWDNGSLRPTFDLQFTGGAFQLVNWERWVNVDCDDSLLTGDVDGNDLRVRMTLIAENISVGFAPSLGNGVSLNPRLTFLGGLAIEVERLGPQTTALPLEFAVLKSFSYSQNNYIWFIGFDFPTAPPRFSSTFTSNEVEIQTNASDIVDLIISGAAGDLSNTSYLSQLRGPYRITWNFTGPLDNLKVVAGYAKYVNPGAPVLVERTWFDARLTPGSTQTSVPSDVLLRLDSESFNKSFDYLAWTANAPSQLELNYYDDRENYTYAHATVKDMPTSLEANVDSVGSGNNSTAKIVYRASAPISRIDYDEYIFLESNATNFIYSHVRLEDVPTSLYVNGTLDIGGTVVEPEVGVRQGISLVGEIIDRVMIRIASKLYSVGQTLRAIPNNILNLPDERGWVSIELPEEGAEIGLLEFWLTSGSYAVADGDFIAFYNDTTPTRPPGAVGTSFSGRMQHIEHLVAGFIEETTFTLETKGNLPFQALFLDDPEDATAVVQISNLPPVFMMKVSPGSLRYTASSTVSSITYTSLIQGQYTRIRLDDLPQYLALNQSFGEVRIDTPFDALTGFGGISAIEMQVSDGAPIVLPGDHILVFQNETVNAVSARAHNLGSMRYTQGAGGSVQFTARGGEPFAMVFVNETTPLHAVLHFNPLPSSLDVTLPGSLQSTAPIQLPSLGSISSVLDFSHIIFGIDLFGRQIVDMLSQVGENLATGIGRFDQNFSFAFDSAANTTLTASIQKGAWSPAQDAQWVHGLRSKQRVSPANSSSLDLTAKLYLSGLPRRMAFELGVEAETLRVNTTIEDFTPAFDYIAIETDSASVDPLGQPKNIRFFTDGILPHTNLSLGVNFRSDLSIGGQVLGQMNVASTTPLKDFYVILTTTRPRPTHFEVLIPEIPLTLNTYAALAEGIDIKHRAAAPIEFVFVKLSRGIVGVDRAAYAIFHDVPKVADMKVESTGVFEMASSNPIRNLPDISLFTDSPGLDLVADLDGQALGSRGSMRLFTVDLGTRLSMLQQGSAFAISSDGVSRLLFEVDDFPISKGLTIDAMSIYAEDVKSVTITVQMVFNSFPIISLDNLDAGTTQIRAEHRIHAFSGATKPTTFVFISVPVGGRGEVSVSSNGIVTAPEKQGRHIVVAAPLLSFLLSQF